MYIIYINTVYFTAASVINKKNKLFLQEKTCYT